MNFNSSVKIEKAVPEDARAIAEVHVASWKTTYRGIMDDRFLNNLSVSNRELRWREILEKRDHSYTCFVVKINNQVIGFGDVGKSRDNKGEYDAEIYACYLLKEYSRKGIGSLLFNQLISDALDKGYHSMMTWVAEKNESRRFYEALNARLLPLSKVERMGNTEIVEVAYGWDDLSLLCCGPK